MPTMEQNPLFVGLIYQASKLYDIPVSVIQRDRSNRREIVECRRFLAAGLNQAGWSSRRMARVLGRERTSVNHLLRSAPRHQPDIESARQETRPLVTVLQEPRAPRPQVESPTARMADALERIATVLEQMMKGTK